MDFVQRMKRALQRGRSATLPPGELTFSVKVFKVCFFCKRGGGGGEGQVG